MGATGHGSDMQRYEGVAGGGGQLVVMLHVAKGGWPIEEEVWVCVRLREQTTKKLIPNLKSLITTIASSPLVSRISSSVTQKARGIQEKEGKKRHRDEGGKMIGCRLERRRG